MAGFSHTVSSLIPIVVNMCDNYVKEASEYRTTELWGRKYI